MKKTIQTLVSFLVLLNSCMELPELNNPIEKGIPPTVTTSSITNITSNTATGGGNVTSQGSSSLTARGVCWSTTQNPTTANSKTNDGTGTGSFTSSITGLSPSTTYYVRAYATNSVGTSYGSQVSFSVGTASSAPTLSSPLNGATDVTIPATLSWNSSDGVISYILQLSTDSSFTNLVYIQTELTETSQQVIGLNNSTLYYWRVNATNSFGTSDWSSVWSFTTMGIVPSAPTLSTPANGATNVSLPPTLSWNASTDATSYTLQVSTNSSFTSFIYSQTGLTETTQQITGLNNSTLYYWRVSAINSFGPSGWSSVWSFTTIGIVPSAPTLSSPLNGTTDVTIPATLSWNASTDATSYTLQVSTNSSFTSFIYSQTGLTQTSQQITGLNNSTLYFWRVSATNSQGTSDWSSVWSFTTMGIVPSAPTLSTPANGATNVSLPPTLSWNASSSASSYTLQVATHSNFTSFVYNQGGLTGTSQQVTGLSNSFQYYWRVSATNSQGTSDWSSVWSFTTTSVPCPGITTVTYEGKTYNTVQIGSQCWLRENLDVGTMIQGSQNSINNGVIEKYCYNNDPNNCNTYGGLYQWNEAMQYSTTPGSQGICPPGWHIPTLAEFQTLGSTAGGDGNRLKASGQGTGAGAGTNTSGFSALLAGHRSSNVSFNYLGNSAYFWSSTEYNVSNVYNLILNDFNSTIYLNLYDKAYGFYVRCLQN